MFSRIIGELSAIAFHEFLGAIVLLAAAIAVTANLLITASKQISRPKKAALLIVISTAASGLTALWLGYSFTPSIGIFSFLALTLAATAATLPLFRNGSTPKKPSP